MAGNGGAQPIDEAEVALARVAPVHGGEHRVRAGLDAEMDVAAEELVLGDDSNELVR